MRFLQGTLLIVGITALSTIAGVFAVGGLIALVQRPGGEPWTRGFGQYLGGLICGAPLGAIAGLVGSIGFIRARDEHRPWSLFVWVGILLGLLTGTAICFHWGLASGNEWWLVVAPAAAASGALGGIVANLASALYESARKKKR